MSPLLPQYYLKIAFSRLLTYCFMCPVESADVSKKVSIYSKFILQMLQLIYLKLLIVAPRVEKTEVLKKGWNSQVVFVFARCIIIKHCFLSWRKEMVFIFLIFTLKLPSTTLNYLNAHSPYARTFFYFKH